MSPADQAAIAFDALLTFIVKADTFADLDRLMDLVMESWGGACEDGREAEAELFDAARNLINVIQSRREKMAYGPRPAASLCPEKSRG